ncbi:MAG: hypothetical protein KatS3mg015_0899 [Fimbriimonadales bacterium]|nr:MAG: hypothetical protein KatS3mg015_0899 [Fimbriimonadales bacterium]
MPLRPLPIDETNLERQSVAAISDVLDVIVELVTNSDDAYTRMGVRKNGNITLFMARARGGELVQLAVRDDAEGMTRERLNMALTRFAKSSGRDKRSGIRGAFGRGLKDTVFAVGEGKIITRSRETGELLEARLAWRNQRPMFDDDFTPRSREAMQVHEDWKGTIVILRPSKQHPSEITVYEPRTLKQRIPLHYALRDIVRRHNVFFAAERWNRRSGQTQSVGIERLQPFEPSGIECLTRRLTIEGLGDVLLTVFESAEPLEGSPTDPWCQFGFSITTDGVPVDHRVFLDGREAARFFWGAIEIPEIAKRLNNGDYSLLKPDRSGVNWRVKALRQVVDAITSELRPLLDAKETTLRRDRRDTIVSREQQHKLIRFLNRKMVSWFEDTPDVRADRLEPSAGGHRVAERGDDLARIHEQGLTVEPSVAYVAPGKKRKFSVYLPDGRNSDLQIEVTPAERARVCSRQQGTGRVAMTFEVALESTAVLGQRVLIEVSDGVDTAFAQIVVHEESERGPARDTPRSHRRAVFTGIDFSDLPDPRYRVQYDRDSGMIIVFLRYPVVSKVLGAEGERAESSEAKVLLAELVTEAVCRANVLRDSEIPSMLALPQAISELDQRRAKCASDIYDFIQSFSF